MQKTAKSTFTQVYVAPSGRAIAYHHKQQSTHQGVVIYNVEPSFSPDGNTFHQLLRTDMIIATDENAYESWTLQCPRLDVFGRVNRSMDTLIFNGEMYMLNDKPSVVDEIVPLPEVRVKEGFFRTSSGKYCYISHDLYGDADASLRLYIGVLGDMRQVAIEKIERFRRGGSIVISTSEGEFHSPFRKNLVPTWAGEELAYAAAKDHLIVETHEGLTIMSRHVVPFSSPWWKLLFKR